MSINHLSSDVTFYILYFRYEILEQVSGFCFGCLVFYLLCMMLKTVFYIIYRAVNIHRRKCRDSEGDKSV
jgi:hypothetical protein